MKYNKIKLINENSQKKYKNRICFTYMSLYLYVPKYVSGRSVSVKSIVSFNTIENSTA